MSESVDKCAVCSENLATTFTAAYDGIFQDCRRCGRFMVSGTALAIFAQGLGEEKRAKLSGWVYDQNLAGDRQPEINSYNYQDIIDRPLPPVLERAERLLVAASIVADGISGAVGWMSHSFKAASYSKNSHEVNDLFSFLRDQQYIKRESHDSFQLSVYGWARVDELSREISSSKQGFVAMWFDDQVKDAYIQGIEPAIRGAGYDPLRIDQTEHINKIDDEIIKQIKRSKFIVADFTDHRGGVYFEAGFAMGLDLPVFWTCRADHMDKLHFDIRQFNCINWQTPDELKERLQVRLEAVLT